MLQKWEIFENYRGNFGGIGKFASINAAIWLVLKMNFLLNRRIYQSKDGLVRFLHQSPEFIYAVQFI